NCWKQRDNRLQDSFLSYSVCTEPGYEPGPPGFWPGALPVVLRAFPPLQIFQRSTSAERGCVAATSRSTFGRRAMLKLFPRVTYREVAAAGLRHSRAPSTRTDKFFAETLQFGCSPRRHSARKIFFTPARPRPN